MKSEQELNALVDALVRQIRWRERIAAEAERKKYARKLKRLQKAAE